jgi:hypothetical protein
VISAPLNATVIINIAGSGVGFQNAGFSVSGTDDRHVLFNVENSPTVTLSGIGFEANLLAVNSALYFANGHIDGSVIAASLWGSGQFNEANFNGSLPIYSVDAAGDISNVSEPCGLAVIGVGLMVMPLTLRMRRPQAAS